MENKEFILELSDQEVKQILDDMELQMITDLANSESGFFKTLSNDEKLSPEQVSNKIDEICNHYLNRALDLNERYNKARIENGANLELNDKAIYKIGDSIQDMINKAVKDYGTLSDEYEKLDEKSLDNLEISEDTLNKIKRLATLNYVASLNDMMSEAKANNGKTSSNDEDLNTKLTTGVLYAMFYGFKDFLPIVKFGMKDCIKILKDKGLYDEIMNKINEGFEEGTIISQKMLNNSIKNMVEKDKK